MRTLQVFFIRDTPKRGRYKIRDRARVHTDTDFLSGRAVKQEVTLWERSYTVVSAYGATVD